MRSRGHHCDSSSSERHFHRVGASQEVQGWREDVSGECVVETQFCFLRFLREGKCGHSCGFRVPLCFSCLRQAIRASLWHGGQVGSCGGRRE